jgi:hypothetical protein
MVGRRCETCGQPFSVVPSRAKLGRGRFCTRACRSFASALPLAERLAYMSTPEPNSGCLLFLGAVSADGYGRLEVNGRTELAHRVAYTVAHGPIPKGLVTDHLCRNRSCINDRHLEATSQRVNVVRGVSLSGQYARATACKYGHPFDDANTLWYRRGEAVHRRCRMCNRMRAQSLRDARRILVSVS